MSHGQLALHLWSAKGVFDPSGLIGAQYYSPLGPLPHGRITPKSVSTVALHIIATLFIGLLVGIVAKLLMPGRDPGGFIITALLGIAGAFVAKFLGQQLGWYSPEDTAGFFASVVGAMILLVLYRLIAHRRMPH